MRRAGAAARGKIFPPRHRPPHPLVSETPETPLVIQRATEADATAIAELRLAVARELTAQFGRGTWSFVAESELSVRAELRTSVLLIARDVQALVGTLRLSLRNPWLGDTNFFRAGTRPVFLTSMAIAPARQRQGVGRALLAAAARTARELGADAIRLDAYDAPAGAGEFYRKSGFREVRRGSYNGTRLIWFELGLASEASG